MNSDTKPASNIVIETCDGQLIIWVECLDDAEPGVVTCNSHCADCIKPEFRQACKESRQ